MAESASEELAPKLEPVAPKLEPVETLFKYRCAHCKSVEFHTRFRIVHLSTIRSCSLQVYQTLPPVPRTDAVFGIACHRCWRRGPFYLMGQCVDLSDDRLQPKLATEKYITLPTLCQLLQTSS